MEEEIDIKDLIVALWRKKFIIIAVTCIFFVLAMLLYGGKQSDNEDNSVPTIISESKKIENNCYETEFMLARGVNREFDGAVSTYKITVDAGVITNLNKFATSEIFLEKVISDMNLKNSIEVKDLKEKISIFANGTSDVITLDVAYSEEDKASEISNRILVELTEKVNKLYKIDELVLIDGPRKLSEDEIKELEEKMNSDTAIVDEKTQTQTADTTAKAPSKKKVILITAASFVLVCGVIVVMELFSDSVKNEKMLEQATKASVLTTILKDDANVNEKVDLLRVSLDKYKTVLITSSENGTGKSFVASKLTKSYETIGKKVALVQAKDLNEEKLKELENSNDIVIIDSESILASAKTLEIAKLVKNTIFVSCERKTDLEKLQRAKASLEEIGGNLIGNVLNKANK